MAIEVPAIYEDGALKLRWPLPLPDGSEVLVTVESVGDAGPAVLDKPIAWPDISERLRRIYGEKLLSENAILVARKEERY